MPPPRSLPVLALLGLVLVLGALPAAAQTHDVRVLSTWLEPVKLDNGTETTHTYEISYDYRADQAVLSIYDAERTLLSQEMTAPPPVPHPDEKATAVALIEADPELAGVLAALKDPIIQGGYINFEGACAETRCLQFTIEPADGSRMERFVIVDLSNATILERDLYPHLRD